MTMSRDFTLVGLSRADTEEWLYLLNWSKRALANGPNLAVDPGSAPVVERNIRRQRMLTEADIQEVIEMYRAGRTTRQIAKATGAHRRTIANRLKLAGIKLRRGKISQGEVAKLIRLYESDLSMAAIGERLNLDPQTVLNYLRKASLETRNRQGKAEPRHSKAASIL